MIDIYLFAKEREKQTREVRTYSIYLDFNVCFTLDPMANSIDVYIWMLFDAIQPWDPLEKSNYVTSKAYVIFLSSHYFDCFVSLENILLNFCVRKNVA